MRQVRGRATRLAAGLAAGLLPVLLGPASAEERGYLHNYSNNTGVSLPSIPLPSGQDEVRAADGLSCRSSVASAGPYLDMGVVGGQNDAESPSTGVYSRVVVPLGHSPKRVDCTRLHELEIERLRMELELARMGLGEPGKAP